MRWSNLLEAEDERARLPGYRDEAVKGTDLDPAERARQSSGHRAFMRGNTRASAPKDQMHLKQEQERLF